MQMKTTKNSKPFSILSISKTNKTILVAGIFGVIGCVGISLFANRALGRPVDFRDAMKLTDKGKPKTGTHSQQPGDSVAVENSGSRHSLEFYTKGVRETMFSAPQPPPPEKPKPVPVVPAPPPPKIVVPIIVPVEINPFADWVYTGTVTIGAVKMALIENTKTREGHYLKQGETFQGAQVAQVTDQMVSFTAGVKPYLLAKSDNINLVPLDRNAGAPITTTGQPAPPPPANAPPVLNTGMPVGMPMGLNFGNGAPSPEIMKMMMENRASIQSVLPAGAVMSETVILK